MFLLAKLMDFLDLSDKIESYNNKKNFLVMDLDHLREVEVLVTVVDKKEIQLNLL